MRVEQELFNHRTSYQIVYILSISSWEILCEMEEEDFQLESSDGSIIYTVPVQFAFLESSQCCQLSWWLMASFLSQCSQILLTPKPFLQNSLSLHFQMSSQMDPHLLFQSK